jgi:hypothetical protein
MPIIIPEVLPEPIPNVRAETVPSSFGGGPTLEAINQQTQKLAVAGSEIGALETLRANQSAVEEAKDKASQLYNQHAFDPQTGIVAARGKDALPATIKHQNDFRKDMNDISEGLTNDIQKGAFKRVAYDMDTRLNTFGMQHADNEMTKFTNQSHISYLNNLITQGTKQWNPDDLSKIMRNGLDAIDGNVQYNGQDAQTAQLKKQEFMDAISTKAVTEGMLNDPVHGVDAAKKFMEGQGKELSEDVKQKIETKIQEQVVSNTAVKVWGKAQYSRNADGTVNLADALKIANSVKGLDDDEKASVAKFVTANVEATNKAIKEDHSASERGFYDKLLAGQSKRQPLEYGIKLATQAGWDEKSRSEFQETAMKLYTGKVDNFHTWAPKQDEATQAALRIAESQIKAKVGRDKDMLNGLMTEFRQRALGKKPEQIRQIPTDMFKGVEIPGKWWGTNTVPTWQLSVKGQAQYAEDKAKLDNYFGADNVEAARAHIVQQRGRPALSAIKDLLSKAHR